MITFKEFLLICEKVSTTPPHAVSGTFVRHSDGSQSYTLSDEPIKSTKGSAKKVTKALEKQGGTGGKAIEKMLKKRKVKKISKIQEQTPTMEPNLYSRQVAMRQGAQKTAQIKHVHQELGAEARAQQSAKNARMKAILSR